ncbi:helix-turn-helix domain-containing protein [Streptomyces sp. NBC_00154]|uniref:MarR family transcriptional regulator n=1 Tax=Streptomyces sp. NBC_00154 TaxID=2975670 RepID=UPI00225730FF|nr:helix-turn-helix domain-containing protein [Streptomyces sp. NBC_00154]MCX5309589.1 MarR family transcriptional regulator [Streptomyces sp. NBC_00154]
MTRDEIARLVRSISDLANVVRRADADLAAWAGAWVLMRRISKTAPVKALVERTGVAQPTVSSHIANARKRGLIDEGGNLTDRFSF